WPGVISIQATLENGTWHKCSGALIHPQWVLTVASCFAKAGDISRWEVVIGATDLSQPGPEAELRHIERLLVHQGYEAATVRNNIALLELEQPVECSDYIQLACVPDSSLAVAELKTCYMAGWRAAPDSGQCPR
ncbi:ACRO protein, partial [Pomatostomus ruficeps]|nr:ACRO protein [Pomatostomus ruficeps]